MPNREIVTLQLGNFSNYVGTHLWNSLDASYVSTDPDLKLDVLYRTSRNYKRQEVYAPRLVLVDLKGSLGTLRKTNDLYEEVQISPENHVEWSGPVRVHSSDSLPKNAFLEHLDKEPVESEEPITFTDELELKAKYWSDYNRIYHHPRTLLELPMYTHGDELNRFDSFFQGKEAFKNSDIEASLVEERVRFFMEECDSPQGFQIFTDIHDGFGGFTSMLQQALQDEYSKKSILTLALSPRQHSVKENERVLVNEALALKEFALTSSLCVPLYLPDLSPSKPPNWSKYLNTTTNSWYHWSGYLSAVIDTMLVPLRLKQDTASLDYMDSLCNPNSQTPIAALSAMLPAPIYFDQIGGKMEHTFKVLRPGLKQDLSFNLTTGDSFDKAGDEHGQMAVFRGLPKSLDYLKREVKGQTNFLVSDVLDNYLASFRSPTSKRYIVNQMYPVLDSTPRLLKSVNEHGLVIDPPEENTIVQEFPIMTRLHSNERVGEFVRSYASQWSASNAMKILRYTHDYTRDDVAAVAEELTDLANEYSN